MRDRTSTGTDLGRDMVGMARMRHRRNMRYGGLPQRSIALVTLFTLGTAGLVMSCATTPDPNDVWQTAQARPARFRMSERPQKGEVATAEILAAFEAEADTEYRLGAGD